MKKILLNLFVIGSCAVLPLTAQAGAQERGMLTGAAIGATAGAVFGAQTNETAQGAMIGAMFGAIAGALLSDSHGITGHLQRPQRIYQPAHQYNQRKHYRHSSHKNRYEVKHRRSHKRMYQQVRRSHHQRRVNISTPHYRDAGVIAAYRFDNAAGHSRGRIRHYARAD